MAGLITIADPNGAVAALLDAAVQVQRAAPSSALVGGVAVICRLATAHRATLDADTVVEERQPGVLEHAGFLRDLDALVADWPSRYSPKDAAHLVRDALVPRMT